MTHLNLITKGLRSRSLVSSVFFYGSDQPYYRKLTLHEINANFTNSR